jgi:hypothetical protein
MATTDAAGAAQGAYNAIVHIPYIGPFLAPAAAATAYAGVMAFGSAEGGFDIPPGVNPLTQLHASEMVLPANLAQGVRNMTNQGGGGGQGGDLNQTINLTAWDGRSVVDMLGSNNRVIAQAVQTAMRGGMSIATGG